MNLNNKLRVVEEADSKAIKWLRAFVICLFIGLIIWELLASLVNSIPWGILLGLLPDWLVPDVLKPMVEELNTPAPVDPPPATNDCTVMSEGILICDDGVHLPEEREGGVR